MLTPRDNGTYMGTKRVLGYCLFKNGTIIKGTSKYRETMVVKPVRSRNGEVVAFVGTLKLVTTLTAKGRKQCPGTAGYQNLTMSGTKR